MNADNFKVNLSLRDTISKLDSGIVRESVTGERIDYHVITGNEDNGAILLVYEKYFSRVGNRITLTIVVDNLDGYTKVHSIGGGASQGMFLKFDWGASASFTSLPRSIFRNDIIDN
ncbi:MAG TPA: DUF6054 family protein [Romboutsia timonensis]|uniref:DUF6054 family protein n=1 Tax=Romboutsia timonensis TaxID=1776391 RepID=A0A921N1M7_9FIRM|nr:DUF6054 family protein [uncultured Romboutsia sp.]HJG96704.1 DUF6054 family protein [Romboutsia timonensis]